MTLNQTPATVGSVTKGLLYSLEVPDVFSVDHLAETSPYFCYIFMLRTPLFLIKKDLIFKYSIDPTWGANLKPPDQESRAP